MSGSRVLQRAEAPAADRTVAPAAGGEAPAPRGPDWARLSGVCLQALILGSLLFLAVANLVASVGGARIFRYQNF